MKRFSLLILAFLPFQFTYSQDTSLFEKKYYISGQDTLPYRILLPEDYNPSKKYPLVLFLHGSGERGSDNALQLIHGAKLFLDSLNRQQYPAIVVFPQCPRNSYWSNQKESRDQDGKRTRHFPVTDPPTKAMTMLMSLVNQLPDTYPVKRKQVYVGGLSMGGMGTFELVFRMPETFAAAFPICGGGNPTTARIMRKTEWWIFHGKKDDVVLPEYSENMVEALKAAGAKVKFTLYPEANHNSWDPAFAEPGLLEWLFSRRR